MYAIIGKFIYLPNPFYRSVQGTVGTNTWNIGGDSYQFSHNISHANYVSSTIKNDIGILVTTTPIQFNSRVNLVPLDYDYVPGGVISRVSGWGRIGVSLTYFLYWCTQVFLN